MIGFILGSTGALLIGLVIGHSWGEKSGYKKGIALAHIQSLPSISCIETPVKMGCIRAKTQVCYPTDRPNPTGLFVAQNTAAANELSLTMARTLLHRGLLVPKIIASGLGPRHEICEIGVSLYVAPDPAYNDYPSLEFDHRTNYGC